MGGFGAGAIGLSAGVWLSQAHAHAPNRARDSPDLSRVWEPSRPLTPVSDWRAPVENRRYLFRMPTRCRDNAGRVSDFLRFVLFRDDSKRPSL
jgi:hypothetical protein